ncbi:MAG: hypothetical protein P5702_08590 [Limnospira sp. PMC 1291.21]|uniref:Uncharacterized protein n=3 Tax=Limnospira TaxID=2596745 RepID=A0A9P1KEK3_9CYAN|nr:MULTISPECIES: hypothetical protein [Limnospira]EKD05925.1 hypothetical protein SPLC1_S560080 [Arthrospira platensis C1]MDC0838450.1 hypothetical protein [Limnoraphis robusta]MDY7054857.1 hypothetical protein [Limnospira fusiformis LS22]QJB27001.1 hypothetical protein HFV01_15880 [Limnospira fusiformis SAG 85.79]EDZ95203.1 hypothetical protein AmaxDRAFT_2116 [Limnospira maxima CS-328]
MQTTEPSPPTSENQRDWLKIAEYVSVVASGVGSLVAAIIFRPLLLAAAPLTVAVALNIINRQRFEQQVRQSTDAAIADVRAVVKSLYDQVQMLPGPTEENSDLDQITEVLTELQRVTQRLEQNALRHEDWEVMNVRFRLMENTINDIKQHPPATNSEHLSQPSVSPGNLIKLEQQLGILYQQVRELQNHNREIVKPYLKRLTVAVKKLQQGDNIPS